MDFLGTLIFYVSLLWMSDFVQSESNDPEYCSFQHFNVSCDVNHVIVMKSARYGRMRLGKCVTSNLGYVGKCSADVMDVMDSRCTGRRSCDVNVADQALHDKEPCSKQVTWHLEATYTCVPVVVPAGANSQCSYNHKPLLLNSTRYLSNSVTSDTSHGTPQCPWKLAVAEGQQISLSVYNTMPLASFAASCYTFGKVEDAQSTKPLMLCPDDFKMSSRVVQVFFSKSRTIEVSFYPGSHLILVQANVEGCPNITLPQHSTAQRTDQLLTITCTNTGETWRLTCKENRWTGHLGNCTTVTTTKGPWAMQHIFQDGILIAVALGVALGIFLGGLLLVIVGSRMKRRQRQRLQQAQLVDPPDYDVRVEAPQRFPSKSPGGGTLSSSNIEYTLSRGTDYTSDHRDKQYSYRKPLGPCPRDIDSTKMCTSPYHAYETPTLT